MLITYIKHLAGIVQTKTTIRAKNFTHNGFTVVELMIVVVISLLLVGVIVSFILGVTDQFAVNAVRGQMNVQMNSATNRIKNDMSYSRFVLAENSVTDSAAPSNDSHWNSGSDQLVLGATARNNANEPLSADYTTSLDNYIYYLNSGTLYRRVLAFSDSNNRYTTSTCAQALNGGCASDTAILRNIESLEFTYYDNSGAETSDYAQASSIKVVIVTKTKQSRHEIELKGGSTFRLASYVSGSTSGPGPDPEPDPPGPSGPGIPTLPSPLTIGYGGISMTNSEIQASDKSITTYGNIAISGSQIRTNSNRFIHVGHRNCGTGSSYGTLCPSSPAPISLGSWSSISTGTACGPALPLVSGSGFSGSQTTSCSPPTTPPTFNKEALVGSIPTGNTSSGQSCNFAGGLTLQGNRRYNGSITGSFCTLNIASSGTIHIKGNLNLYRTDIWVDNYVTGPITLVVDGTVVLNDSDVYGSLFDMSTIRVSIISFHSSNSSCSNSDTCSTLSSADLYSSRNLFAIDTLADGGGVVNLYAPFSSIRLNDDTDIRANQIFAQGLSIISSGVEF